MAYEDLKSAIKQAIKQNGNQEITGNLLQSTLLNIVNTIGFEIAQEFGNDNTKVLSQKASSDLLLHSDELIFTASAKILGLFIKSGISIGNTIDTKSFTEFKGWGISVLALAKNASVSYKQVGFGKGQADTVYVTDTNFKVIHTQVLQSAENEISYTNNTNDVVFIFINSDVDITIDMPKRIKFTGVVFDVSSYVYNSIFISSKFLHSDELIFTASAKILGLFIKSGISIGNTIDTKSFTEFKGWGISVLALAKNASVSYKQVGFGKGQADTVYVTDTNFKVIHTQVLQSAENEISYTNNTNDVVFIFINSDVDITIDMPKRIKFTGVVFDVSSYVYNSIFISSKLLDISINNAQSYSSFKAIYKFGVIGDSLSVGHMTNPKTGVTNSRNLKFSWGQLLARKNSQVCLNFGFSGATAETFFTNTLFKPSEKLVEQENKCQAYICAMGANYEPAGLGTIADINDDNPELNAKTFYGQYGRILQLIHNTFADSIVFCIPLTYPRKNDSRNNAIKAICDKFKSFAYYIDLDKYNDFIKNNLVGTVITEGRTYSKFYYEWHYTAAGYALYGDIIEKAISNYMIENADSNFNSIGQIAYGSNDVIN